MTQPRLLGGRYELDGVIGRGGMAEVYRARDIRLDRLVAIKTLRHDLARDPTFQARFRREAQSAASLNHPSVIAVYDTGEDLMNGLPVPYIVMEYVDGQTLRELLGGDRRLLPERALEIVDGVLRALDYSHRGGIVHRDIKPANVMLTKSGEVKVMDFGIARAVSDASATMTQTAQVIGTAQYLSPEQARGERVDARSDLYSTGCLLYELLTGRPPFTGDSPVAIAYQHVRENPVPPSQVDPEIPRWADAIVLKAMSKDAGQRYQSAAEMRADIQRALSGIPVTASAYAGGYPPPGQHTQRMGPATAAAGTGALPPYQYGPPPEREPERDSGKRVLLWSLLGLLLAAAAIVVGFFLMRDTAVQVDVPNVVGKRVQQAEDEVIAAKLKPVVREEFTEEQKPGVVFKTDPAFGARIEQGATVTLFVSKGTKKVKVPRLRGKTEEEARQELEDAGLEVGQIQRRPADNTKNPVGTVLSSDPKDGDEVEEGSPVDLVLAAEGVVVPSVIGRLESDAKRALGEVGLRNVDVTFEEVSGRQPGTVLRQTPQAGRVVGKNSRVTLVVAKEPPPPTEEPTPSQSPTPEPSESTPPGEDGDGTGETDGPPDFPPGPPGRP